MADHDDDQAVASEHGSCSDTCETRAGYLRHRKAGQEPCQPSRDANTAYNRSYRRGLGLGPRALTPGRLL